jgi:hypothetical protein
VNKAELLAERLQAARRWTLSLLNDYPDSTWFDMSTSGHTHVAWQVGHITASMVSLIHVRCLGKSFEDCLPADFRDKFGIGSSPVADAAAHPPVAEIRALFERVHAEAVAAVAEMSEADLSSPAAGPPHPLFTTREEAVATAVMHEAFHAGQLAMLRRLAGKGPLR